MSRIQVKERQRIINQAKRKILNIEKTITKGSFKDVPFNSIARWHRTAGVIDDIVDQNNVIVSGDHYVTNLSDLPNPVFHPGKIIYVLNFGVGGSPWLSNGVIWIPAGGRIVVNNFYNPVVLGGTVTDEQILRQAVFPVIPNQGNVIRIGDIVCVTIDTRKSGIVNTYTAGYRFGKLGTLSDPFFETPSASTTANISTTQRHYLCRLDNTNVKKMGVFGSAPFGGVTAQIDGGNLVITDIDISSLNLSYTGKMNGGTDTLTSRTFMVELYSSGAAS